MPMNPRLLRPTQGGFVSPDADARAYLTAVRQADGANLEPAVAKAISDFVIGCKADGIWDAIKASCILAGARTLTGALVPLKGTAPDSFNFVAGDYDRKTGLLGNGSNKYLDAKRLATDDSQNNYHQCVYASSAATATTAMYLGNGSNTGGASNFFKNSGDILFRSRSSNVNSRAGEGSATGFIGSSRSISSEFVARSSGSNGTLFRASESFTGTADTFVFRWGSDSFYSNARIAFYSIGESLNLALLDSRVSALITAIGAS